MGRFSKNSLSNLSERIYPWTKRTVEKGIGANWFGLFWIDSQGSQDKSYPRPIHVDIPWKTEQWKISTNTLCKLFFFFDRQYIMQTLSNRPPRPLLELLPVKTLKTFMFAYFYESTKYTIILVNRSRNLQNTYTLSE